MQPADKLIYVASFKYLILLWWSLSVIWTLSYSYSIYNLPYQIFQPLLWLWLFFMFLKSHLKGQLVFTLYPFSHIHEMLGIYKVPSISFQTRMELWTGALSCWKCHWPDLKSAGLFWQNPFLNSLYTST